MYHSSKGVCVCAFCTRVERTHLAAHAIGIESINSTGRGWLRHPLLCKLILSIPSLAQPYWVIGSSRTNAARCVLSIFPSKPLQVEVNTIASRCKFHTSLRVNRGHGEASCEDRQTDYLSVCLSSYLGCVQRRCTRKLSGNLHVQCLCPRRVTLVGALSAYTMLQSDPPIVLWEWSRRRQSLPPHSKR